MGYDVDWLAAQFVGKPLNIAVVGAAWAIAFFALRASAFGASRRSRILLTTAGAWLIYAAWEWLVQARTPEANIRVDLLIIWPVLALLSAWALFRTLR